MYLATGELGPLSALGYSFTQDVGYQFIWVHTVLNYFFAVLIYCVVREKVLIRFLEVSWLRYLGRISYGMYVYHLALIWFVRNLVEELTTSEIGFWIRLAVSLAATILVATFSYYLLERPILNLKDRFFAWSKDSDSSDQRPAAIL